MFNKKQIIVFIIVLIVIVIALYFLFFQKPEQATPDLTDQLDQTGSLPSQQLLPDASQPVDTSQPAKPVTQEDRDKTEIQNTAKFFIAMLGSYSPDAKFQNVIDLRPMMTTSMQAWADDFIVRNLPNIEENNEKLTTQVFKTQVLSYTGSHASVLAYTRREKVNDQGSKVYSQDAQVSLVKLSGSWKVDSVEWK